MEGWLKRSAFFGIKIGGEGWILHKVEGGFCILGWKGLDSAQSWGRILYFGRKKLDPAQNQVAILHFGKKKVESAKYGAVLFGG